MDYLDKVLKQIDELDSKDSRWDKQHYIDVANICKCRNCYSCAVKIWNYKKQVKDSRNVI